MPATSAGMTRIVAWVERSETRESGIDPDTLAPDFAPLNPGYLLNPGYSVIALTD
jgi:hypothetical protein